MCRQDLDRLQKLEDDEKDTRDPSVHMDDFFQVSNTSCRPQASFVSPRSSQSTGNGGGDDDVFLRPPLWEDITSSIQKLDPENADMLASQLHVKLETEDVVTSPVLSPVEIKTEPLPSNPTLHLLEGPTSNSTFINRHSASGQSVVLNHRTTTTAFKIFPTTNSTNNNNDSSTNHHQANTSTTSPALYGSMNRLMYVSPLTPPISDPGSPLGGPPRRTPPPPYPQPPIINAPHRIQSQSITKFNRRNNPELEKRRVHHCDFIGK